MSDFPSTQDQYHTSDQMTSLGLKSPVGPRWDYRCIPSRHDILISFSEVCFHLNLICNLRPSFPENETRVPSYGYFKYGKVKKLKVYTFYFC